MPREVIRAGLTTLPGQLLGVGVDILRLGRVRELVTKRLYTDREREVFADQPELPFVGREAALKAVGVASILGLPLDQMPLDSTADGLVFVPGQRFLEIMSSRNVAGVSLDQHALDDNHCAITAMAWGSPADHEDKTKQALSSSRQIRWACVMLRVSDADPSALSDAERAFAATRRHASESIATRHAARIAVGELGVRSSFEIAGGGDVAPSIVGLDRVFLSLTHERDVAAAMVAFDESDGASRA